MSIETTEKVFLAISLTTFFAGLLWLGVAAFFAYTKMDLMMKQFENSPAVTNRRPFLDAGPCGRLFALGGVIGPLVNPKPYLRDGGVTAKDLAQFPAELKRKLLILHRSSWLLMFMMGCVGMMMLFGLV